MIDELYSQGRINDYFYKKLSNPNIMLYLDDEHEQGLVEDAEYMSSIGVDDLDKEKFFHHVSLMWDVPSVLRDMAKDLPTSEDIKEVYKELIDNKDQYGSSSITDVFCSVALAARKIGIPINSNFSDKIEECESVETHKIAYPQGFAGDHMRPRYDINKWMQATRGIYSRMNRTGIPFHQAFDEITSSWDKMEVLNFKYWLRFYTEGVPAKYPKLADEKVNVKTAQYHGENGFFLPPAGLPMPEKAKPREDFEKKPSKTDQREKIEIQRAKILSRLSAAEKLLASLDGQSFAGDDQELMLKLLQDLKRKVQIANKITVKSSLFEDLIYRAGNFLKEAHDSDKGRDFFFKIAQDPFADAMSAGGEDPFAAPAQAPAAPAAPATDPTKDTEKAFEELQLGMTSPSGVVDSDDKKKDPPPKPAPAPAPTQEKKPEKKTNVKNEDESFGPPKKASAFDDIIVTAQDLGVPEEEINIGEAEAAPPEDKPAQNRPKLKPQAEDVPKGDLTVTEEELTGAPDDDTDDVIEAALDNITINDAISRLEILVGIYKKREISRQLSILDIMMDQLGLSSYFPSLGEAMGKALESNQYISTRLEDVLAKLKGSVESADADEWMEKQKAREDSQSPETKAVQTDLEQKQDKEKERKELRKQRENEKLEKGKPGQTGVGERSEELAGPAEVEQATPIKAR